MKKLYVYIMLAVTLLVFGAIPYFNLVDKINERFDPNIPSDVDYVLIEDYNNVYLIDKQKDVLTLIKLLINISEHVGEGPDFKTLSFINNKSEVYTIPYDKIGYPNEAVLFIEKYISNEHLCYRYSVKDKAKLGTIRSWPETIYDSDIDGKLIVYFKRKLTIGEIRELGLEQFHN